MKKIPTSSTIGRAVLFVLAFGVAAYAMFSYSLQPLGSSVHPEMRAGFVTHPIGIYVHAFAAAVALAIGPIQLSARLRRARPRAHRWMGRAYLGIGVLVGGRSGLYISLFAFGGPAARLGFALLAVCWLYSGARALLAIRDGRVRSDDYRRTAHEAVSAVHHRQPVSQ